jgi:Ca-activated chloride channel family protein
MKKILYSLVFSLLTLNAFSYSWLQVFNPHTWDKSGQGSIDEALLTIEPKGIYFECGLYLTFSANGHQFSAEDTLEVSYYFTLPKGSIVHDSWLWVEDSIVHARIMDRWTAYQIYEGIVKRRRDPSVLYKDWENNYHLQIYPMQGNSTRKVKITFMLPARWASSTINAGIPFDMLSASHVPLDKLTLVTWEDEKWGPASVAGSRGISFKSSYTKEFGFHRTATIDQSLFTEGIQVTWPTPLKDGLFLSSLSKGMEGYYQMAFVPSEAMDFEYSKKVAVLFDFEEDNSYYTNGNSVYGNLKSTLYNYLSPRDSFAIILSGNNLQTTLGKWMPADSATLWEVFEKLGEKPVKNYSDLYSLLKKGIQFINGQNKGGELLLLSNSDNYADNKSANELMDSLKKLDPLPVTHVVDFYDRWETYYYIGNQYYNGNEYFFTMLTRFTHGNLYAYNYWEQKTDELLSKVFSGLGGFASSFDLHTKLEEGYCHSRFNLDANRLAVAIDEPIIQVGKFNGRLPLVIEASGEFNHQVKSVKRSISETELFISDTLIEEMWTGNFIESMEKDWWLDNKLVNELVKLSISQRVLSRYTAFIALEPGMEPVIDPSDPGNQSGNRELGLWGDAFGSPESNTYITKTRPPENTRQFADVRVLPNPFASQIRIQIALPEDTEWTRVKVEVFNLMGQKVREFNPDDFQFNGFINITWDGSVNSGEQIPEGPYLMVISGESFRNVIKILKVK